MFQSHPFDGIFIIARNGDARKRTGIEGICQYEKRCFPKTSSIHFSCHSLPSSAYGECTS
jgi:hypothetical protein